MENEYGKIKLISVWNDRKLEDRIKLEVELFIETLPSCSIDKLGNITDNFSASFDKLGNIEVDYFVTGETKLFKHPVLLQDVELVIHEIADWLLEEVMYE
ncbi:MAG: hypothetical protein CMJ25_12635 [Phycisphaerae bacterium]|nr:hypothetical protein [Phycisphaerae bacterium]|tara:strand:+ start:2045 stop:2344 length:300 start_codon:yes stop_codon:yes gene_type:complete